MAIDSVSLKTWRIRFRRLDLMQEKGNEMYKIGDKVRIKDDAGVHLFCGDEMAECLGEVGIVREEDNCPLVEMPDGSGWSWLTTELELVKED